MRSGVLIITEVEKVVLQCTSNRVDFDASMVLIKSIGLWDNKKIGCCRIM